MAKKTAKKPTKKKVPPTPTATVEKPSKAAKAAPKKPSAPAINNDLIGVAAGDVWGVLHGKGWQTLAAVKKAVSHPTDVTLAAVAGSPVRASSTSPPAVGA